METETRQPAAEGSRTPEQLYAERERRIDQAVLLEQPDRIPIILPMSYMLAEIGGITKQELHDDPKRAQMLLEQAASEYQPDSLMGLFPPDPKPHLLLGDRMTRFPGHGLDPNSEYQFVEQEFMKADDYDDFLDDPADWAVRVYLPRAFSGLEAFSMLPPLGMFLFGSYNLINSGVFAAPPLAASFQAFAKSAQATAESIALALENIERLSALGFSAGFLVGSCIIEAPFDFMSDTLRGMRGIMLDIFQRPDKLLAAEEKVSRFQIKFAVDSGRVIGVRRCFIPLHRGSDGFMSLSQFEKFYWPQFKNMIFELVENGITPYVFYEGVWDQRLEYLTELPRGKTVGWFHASDIFKVKEIVGNTMCIIGGMPSSMLTTGPVEAIRERTKDVCRIAGRGGGFMMSVGIGEMSGSRPEFVKAWIDATHEYGVY